MMHMLHLHMFWLGGFWLQVFVWDGYYIQCIYALCHVGGGGAATFIQRTKTAYKRQYSIKSDHKVKPPFWIPDTPGERALENFETGRSSTKQGLGIKPMTLFRAFLFIFLYVDLASWLEMFINLPSEEVLFHRPTACSNNGPICSCWGSRAFCLEFAPFPCLCVAWLPPASLAHIPQAAETCTVDNLAILNHL